MAFANHPFDRFFLILVIYYTKSVESGKLFTEFQCRNNMSSPLNSFCVMDNYDTNMPPLVNDTAVEVSLSVTFDDIVSISDNDCTVTFHARLDLSWVDHRLIVVPQSSRWIHPGTDQMYTFLESESLNVLWKPDLDIINLERFDVRELLDRQGEIGLLGNKRIWYVFPVQITLNCPKFEFSSYPFDTQSCEFLLGSYQWVLDKLRFKGNMIYDKKLQRPLQYEVDHVNALSFEEGLVESLDFEYTKDGEIEYYDEKYSHFAIEMQFSRKIKALLVSTYLPSFLIVVSSWLGFLIGTSSIPGRLTVTVILLLLLINMR